MMTLTLTTTVGTITTKITTIMKITTTKTMIESRDFILNLVVGWEDAE